jgi:hypothetical protein
MLDRQPTQFQSVLEAMNKSARPIIHRMMMTAGRIAGDQHIVPAFYPLSTSWLIMRSRTKITCNRVYATQSKINRP